MHFFAFEVRGPMHRATTKIYFHIVNRNSFRDVDKNAHIATAERINLRVRRSF
jgi:hypothetical protein